MFTYVSSVIYKFFWICQGTGCEMYTETLSSSFIGMSFAKAAEICFVKVRNYLSHFISLEWVLPKRRKFVRDGIYFSICFNNVSRSERKFHRRKQSLYHWIWNRTLKCICFQVRIDFLQTLGGKTVFLLTYHCFGQEYYYIFL